MVTIKGCITIFTLIYIIVWCSKICKAHKDDDTETILKRTKRQFKDASTFSKDSSVSGSAIGNTKYKELLQKMQGLETKIDSEKALISNLQTQLANATKLMTINARNISALSQKLKDVESTGDLDENYWNTSETCGGVIVAQNGQLGYSGLLYRLSNLKAACVWTIRANYRSKIKLYIPANAPPGTVVTEFFINEDGTHTTAQTNVTPSKKYLFNGPLIQISTPADLLPSGVTFVFEGVGKLVHQDTKFRHYNIVKYDGSFGLNLNTSNKWTLNTRKVFTTVIINTATSNLAELRLQSSRSCMTKASIVLQTGSNMIQQTHNRTDCCGNNCTEQRYYSMDGWFSVSYSSLQPQSDLKLTWRSWWNESDSLNKCGGVLMGKGGKISYKKTLSYLNNERCTWVINPFPKTSIRFSSFSSGIESTYDHLVVTEIDKEMIKSTEITSSMLLRQIEGRVILVTFYTDNSIVRNGFDLTWESIGPVDNNRNLDNEKILHNKLKETEVESIQLIDKGFVLYVISNSEKDASSLNMTLSLSRSIDCGNSQLAMIGSSQGHTALGNSYYWIKPCIEKTNSMPSWSIASPDGIGSIFLENRDSKSQVSLQLNWAYVPGEKTDANDEEKCGGVIHGLSGRLSYKLEESYDNGERCLWLIHSPTTSAIELKLLKEGFELCCDYIIVNTVNPETGTINNETTVLTRENNTKIFRGQILIVTFRSDGSVIGKGFVLRYTGVSISTSQSSLSKYTYKLLHRDSPMGSFEYPLLELDGWNWESSESQIEENEIMILAYSSAVEPGENSASVMFNVTIEDAVFGEDENCKSDILNFYSSPSREGFYLAESYPKTECQKMLNGSCANCASTKLSINDTTPHKFGSMYRAFVAIYKPVKSHFTNQSFHIHWDTSSGCGGVMQDASEGRIIYKLSARYKNSEQCLWTVNSPGASSIRFTLLSSGFENCCDYIILNSLNPQNGSIGPGTILNAGKPTVSMDGPVVFVTFRTDESATGQGFSLTYFSLTSETDRNSNSNGSLIPSNETSYRYYHFHGKRRNSSFSFPQHSRDPGLGKNEIVTYTFSPEAARNETLSRFGTKITITDINLGFDSLETCVSDSLRFYDTPTRMGFNATRSFSVEKDNDNCLDDSADRVWICEDCDRENTSRSEQLVFSTTFPAFITIIKSTSMAGEENFRKTFRMEWTDNPNEETTTTTTPHSHYYG